MQVSADVHLPVEDEEISQIPDTVAALVDITCADEKGNSALMLAAGEDRVLLVQHILHLAGETGRMEQVLLMRNSEGMAALDIAIRRGAGRSATLIAEAASKERRRQKKRLRRSSTSACVLRRRDRYKSEEPPTVRLKDLQEAARRRREEEDRIDVMADEAEKILNQQAPKQHPRHLEMARQRTISANSLPVVESEQPTEQKSFAQKAVSTLTEKLSNVLRPKKQNRIETLPPLDPNRRGYKNKQSSLDNTEPFTPNTVEEEEFETLGPDGFYPSEEKAMSSSSSAYRFPKILSRRRAASEHRDQNKK